MRSLINDGPLGALLTSVFVLVFLLGSSCAVARRKGEKIESSIVVEAEVLGMQGSCTIVGCPWIQYKIDLDKIIENNEIPSATDGELQSLNVCGESGLVLGGSYRFYLARPGPDLTSATRHPRTIDGDFAECDFIFSMKEVKKII